jgi:hypothetical protein
MVDLSHKITTGGNTTQLSPYEIVAPIAAGEMSEVYRARENWFHCSGNFSKTLIIFFLHAL